MTNKTKQRIRLTGKAYQVIEKVREGRGTREETFLAECLYGLDRSPYERLRLSKKKSPAAVGFRNHLLKEEYLEEYQDKSLDFLDSQFPKPEGIEEEDTFSDSDGFIITAKGKSLLEWLSLWNVVTPPNDIIADYLDKFEKSEEIPFWALKGLVRDGFVRKIEDYLDEISEVREG